MFGRFSPHPSPPGQLICVQVELAKLNGQANGRLFSG